MPDPVARHHPAFQDATGRIGRGGRGDRRRTGDDRRLIGQRLDGFPAPDDEEPSGRERFRLAGGRRCGSRASEAESFI